MFSPITASQNITEEFRDYISTQFHIADREYAELFTKALSEEGMISKGPYLDINDAYRSGSSMMQLIQEGEVSSLFEELEGNLPDAEKEIPLYRGLYVHQENAIRKANLGRNMIVTTGTGSGKTECFMIPIVNHLLREAENGPLTSGVRAILIYPMNALANDQMKRLRRLLKSYPEITFGVYNSSTKHNEAEGIAEYGRVFKDEQGRPMRPLPNELVSREKMQAAPPHILVTNYAMLEYMMLRPKDDLVFSGAKLRFLVLDEAHIYRGTTGMETSLLLKRLKARISNPANVINILTSATLGGKDADDDIVQFARTLCSSEFQPEDIIRSQTIQPVYEGEPTEVPFALFHDIAHPDKPLDEIAADYGFVVPKDQPEQEFLYGLCTVSGVYRELRRLADRPLTIQDITGRLRRSYPLIREADVVDLISAAARAQKDHVPLIKARYHLFVKTLEGAYISLGEGKSLSLVRRQSVRRGDEEYRLFECAVCDECGGLAVVGRLECDQLVFASNSYDSAKDFYYLRDRFADKEATDEEDEDTGERIEREDYRLCPKCATVIHESLQRDGVCRCGRGRMVPVTKAAKTAGGIAKCPGCHSGSLRTFYLGYDAATAVLGTSLFEELPESEIRFKSKGKEEGRKGLFRSAERKPQEEIVRKQRQFLSFSDSRAEAAFFASYMTASYQEFLRRRGIWHVVEQNRANMSAQPWEIRHFVQELTSYFDSCRTFAEPGDKGSENLTAVSRKNAWIAVLNEMVNARRGTSLSALGVIQFQYKGNTKEIMEGVAEEYGQDVGTVMALFDLLAMDIVYGGALEGECDLTDDDREYIFYTARPKRFKRCKDIVKDKKKTSVSGWSCSVRKNGTLIRNGRLKRIMQVLQIEEKEANDLLNLYWDEVLQGGEDCVTSAGNDEYYFRTERFVIRAGTEDVPIYRCDVCGRTTMINCKDRCTSIKCEGHLVRVSHEELIQGNHYAKLYRSRLMQPLHIREHTAQLGREEQQRYQEMFIKKELNALSCSTTFEMGVDVGDLETVYLRNVPPSPANYVQRAGRSGRGLNAAAFSLTYAKLSSHDFTFYRSPEQMIAGTIGVPLFTVRNEKVIQRHIFAVALSKFFAENPDVYDYNDADMLLNQNGYERFCDFLNRRPPQLQKLLQASIPAPMHDIMGINDFSWVDRMIGENGVMRLAVEDFRGHVAYYENEVRRFQSAGLIQEAAVAQKNLFRYRRGKADRCGKNDLIEFLARNNILPKYGFPVDTVELQQNSHAAVDGKLQMVRDLQLAISEYAPDAQVVADGKLYTSRYIRKSPQENGKDWEIHYIAQCGNESCGTWNQRTIPPDPAGEVCVACGDRILPYLWHQAIEPRMGFVADNRPKEVTMRRPNKSYRSDDYYLGDVQRQVLQKFSFVTEGGCAFQMETTANDSLMVVCNDNFYVCPRCGYAESASENKEGRTFNSHQKMLTRKHVKAWGKECESEDLKQYKLCHVFKTDVVRILFASPKAGRQDVMLSVMYALLEALSAVMDIERNDIKGCLHKVMFDGRMIYSVVLYDAVAGGAGHVRRMVTESGDQFLRVVEKAIAVTKGCNCDPSCYSCLRNYYNSRIHDLLNRHYAYDFLQDYADRLIVMDNEEFGRVL